MIRIFLEALVYARRAQRYREISSKVTEIITRETQMRLGRSLADAYLKATGQGSSEEDRKNFATQIGNVNFIMSKENANRIREWTVAILDEEERFISGK